MNPNNFTVYIILLASACHEVDGHPYSCYARDCQDVQNLKFTSSGVYYIIPDGMYTGYNVYCDLNTDGGGWLVFQRRTDGSVDFNRTWDEYVTGFGDATGEFWLGNQALKSVLSQGQYELQIEIVYETPFFPYAKYHATANFGIFDIGKYDDNYRISIGVPTGHEIAAGMLYHDGAEFSARDKENNPSNCSSRHTGGWWFKDCRTVNLNGIYGNSTTQGITWKYGKTDFALKASEMKIRRI